MLVASDGSRSNKTSGGACIIATEGGDKIISRYTPDFGDTSQINSHLTDIFETLAVLLFLRQYSQFFKIAIQSQIIYYFDNKEVINKPQIFPMTGHITRKIIRLMIPTRYLKIQHYFPWNFKMNNVKGHQDKRVRKNKLTMIETLNIKTDWLIGEKASIPKKIDIKILPSHFI